MSNDNCKKVRIECTSVLIQTTVVAMVLKSGGTLFSSLPACLPVHGDLHAVLLGDIAEVERLQAGASAQNYLPVFKTSLLRFFEIIVGNFF